MKTILTALLATGLFSGVAIARAPFDQVNSTAPKSVFDQIRDTAPRSVFDQLNATASRMATADNDSIVGELAPVFDTLRDNAP